MTTLEIVVENIKNKSLQIDENTFDNIQTILNQSTQFKLTDDDIIYIFGNVNNDKIISLDASKKESLLSNKSIKLLINLKRLVANDNDKITDDSIFLLKNLEELHIANTTNIDSSVSSLKYLKILDARRCNLKGNSIKNHNLTCLNLDGNQYIEDEHICHMINLHTLDIAFKSKISNNGIKNLINLRNLNAADNDKITDEGIKNLNLECLYATWSCGISHIGTQNQKKLEVVYIFGNKNVKYSELKDVSECAYVDW